MADKTKKSEKNLSRPFLIGNFIKTFFYILVGIFLVAGNYFLESSFVSGEEIKEEVFKLDYSKENYLSDRGVIRFSEESESGILNSVEVDSYENGNEYIIGVESAKLWGNFEISNAKVNFVADKLVIIPNHAAFDLEFDGDRLVLSVFDGDVYVGILSEGIGVSEYVDEYSDLFMNKLLVPRDSQVTISTGKLDERIEALLYSKLVKEFKYSAIPTSKEESDWVSKNGDKDSKYIESVKQDVISEIIYRGPSVSDTLLGDFIFWSEENLTFIPEKKNEIIFDHLFAFLDDAINYANDGDEVMSELRLEEFDEYLASLPSGISKSDEYYKRYDLYIEWLSVFGSEDAQYSVFVELLKKKFEEGRDIYEIVNILWLDVYNGIDLGDVAAESALDRYYSFFDSTLGDDSDFAFYKDYTTYNNQLFDNLLLRYSTFYKDGYFAIKNVLEQELLGLYESGRLRDELSQAFISNKIRFLKRLMSFFFDEEISVVEAKEILSRLVEEIDELMPADRSEVAVIELFEAELEDIGDFWGYLNSPEYHLSKTYGATHEERYESYLVDKDTIYSVINIQEDILGEVVSELTVSDVEKEILSFFTENEDVSDLTVLDLEEVDQRYVKVQGVIGGYSFEAVFDRSQAILKDVYTYGELVSDRPVTLDNLLSLLKENFAEFAEEELEEEELTEETIAQRRARLYVVERVSNAGFVVEMENVSVVDETDSVYRVEGVYLPEYEDILVTFDYLLLRNERAKNIFLSVRGRPVVLESEMTLDELAEVVIAEEDFSVSGVRAESEETGVLR
ncbi:hypothetical protein GF366_03950 [Candidatus Peregrinibacteria bacterium]|nr:hypothetical protein [Candidatus Peregrinibacteria bacterium]